MPTDRITLYGEAAYVPLAYLDNQDSHFARSDLGPTPNITHEGTGTGFQLEGYIDYALTDRWSIGIGGRYWRLESDGSAAFGNKGIAIALPLNEFISERYGIFLQSSLTF